MSVDSFLKQSAILELLLPAAQACDRKLRDVGGVGKSVLGGDYLFDQIGDAFSGEEEDRPEIAFAPGGVLLEGMELFLSDGFDYGHLFELFIKTWGQLRGVMDPVYWSGPYYHYSYFLWVVVKKYLREVIAESGGVLVFSDSDGNRVQVVSAQGKRLVIPGGGVIKPIEISNEELIALADEVFPVRSEFWQGIFYDLRPSGVSPDQVWMAGNDVWESAKLFADKLEPVFAKLGEENYGLYLELLRAGEEWFVGGSAFSGSDFESAAYLLAGTVGI